MVGWEQIKNLGYNRIYFNGDLETFEKQYSENKNVYMRIVYNVKTNKVVEYYVFIEGAKIKTAKQVADLNGALEKVKYEAEGIYQ